MICVLGEHSAHNLRHIQPMVPLLFHIETAKRIFLVPHINVFWKIIRSSNSCV